MSWLTGEDVINSLTTIICVPLVLIFPGWIFWFLQKNAVFAQGINFKQSYNSLYLNVDYFNKEALAWMAVSISRQLAMSFAVVFFTYNSAF